MPRIEPSPSQLVWEKTISPVIASDVIWGLDAYRSALYLLACVQDDLRQVNALAGVRDQLVRAAGDVAAAIAEGYSRSTKADRVRFYGYGLGSIRECIVWYLGLRDVLPEDTLNERLILATRCRSLLLGMMRSSRTNQAPRANNTRPERGHFER